MMYCNVYVSTQKTLNWGES